MVENFVRSNQLRLAAVFGAIPQPERQYKRFREIHRMSETVSEYSPPDVRVRIVPHCRNSTSLNVKV